MAGSVFGDGDNVQRSNGRYLPVPARFDRTYTTPFTFSKADVARFLTGLNVTWIVHSPFLSQYYVTSRFYAQTANG
jgi:hypothetical protein